MTPVAGRVSTSHGLTWFARGWRAFATAPARLIGVMLLGLLLLIGLSFIPVLGSLVSTLIWPALYGGYVLMCRAALANGRPSLDQFFAGLTRRECRLDAIALGALLLFGHILAVIITTLAFFLFCLLILGGVPWDTLAEIRAGASSDVTISFGLLLAVMLTLLVALVPYTLLAMVMIYAAPLVVDRRASALSSLGASFNACLRNILPLGVFALAYLLLIMVAIIPLGLGLLVFVPVSVAALAASYMDIFGEEGG